MGIALAFAIGYLVGANTGREGYQEVVDSLAAVRDSEEFKGLLSAVRTHLSATLRQWSEVIDEGTDDTLARGHLLERVRTLVGRAGVTSPAS